MYSVKLGDGSIFRDLELNGNNFVSSRPVSANDFACLPGRVEITGGDEDYSGLIGEHECMELVQVTAEKDGYYFILRDIEATELGRLEAKLDYVAMMAGVEV